jgi:hypothetical protein
MSLADASALQRTLKPSGGRRLAGTVSAFLIDGRRTNCCSDSAALIGSRCWRRWVA